jgi:hypothetical protein
MILNRLSSTQQSNTGTRRHHPASSSVTLWQMSLLHAIYPSTRTDFHLSSLSHFQAFIRAKATHNVEPQSLYHEFMALDQAGSAIMAFDSRSELFAVKKYKRDLSFHVESVRSKAKSDCVVSVIEAYIIADDMCIVYEYMDVVLRHILATPKGQLVPHEIAVICREVRLSPHLTPESNSLR